MMTITMSFSITIRGVGTGKIIGRIHMAQMTLGKTYFPVSITILESSDVEFLFGLDMLKRHRCSIDLGKNVLRIEGHSGSEEISFL
jgi:DNA damage-inducible protein 1